MPEEVTFKRANDLFREIGCKLCFDKEFSDLPEELFKATAIEAVIIAAYKKWALKNHPDKHGNSPEANVRFQDIAGLKDDVLTYIGLEDGKRWSKNLAKKKIAAWKEKGVEFVIYYSFNLPPPEYNEYEASVGGFDSFHHTTEKFLVEFGCDVDFFKTMEKSFGGDKDRLKETIRTQFEETSPRWVVDEYFTAEDRACMDWKLKMVFAFIDKHFDLKNDKVGPRKGGNWTHEFSLKKIAAYKTRGIELRMYYTCYPPPEYNDFEASFGGEVHPIIQKFVAEFGCDVDVFEKTMGDKDHLKEIIRTQFEETSPRWVVDEFFYLEDRQRMDWKLKMVLAYVDKCFDLKSVEAPDSMVAEASSDSRVAEASFDVSNFKTYEEFEDQVGGIDSFESIANRFLDDFGCDIQFSDGIHATFGRDREKLKELIRRQVETTKSHYNDVELGRDKFMIRFLNENMDWKLSMVLAYIEKYWDLKIDSLSEASFDPECEEEETKFVSKAYDRSLPENDNVSEVSFDPADKRFQASESDGKSCKSNDERNVPKHDDVSEVSYDPADERFQASESGKSRKSNDDRGVPDATTYAFDRFFHQRGSLSEVSFNPEDSRFWAPGSDGGSYESNDERDGESLESNDESDKSRECDVEDRYGVEFTQDGVIKELNAYIATFKDKLADSVFFVDSLKSDNVRIKKDKCYFNKIRVKALMAEGYDTLLSLCSPDDMHKKVNEFLRDLKCSLEFPSSLVYLPEDKYDWDLMQTKVKHDFHKQRRLVRDDDAEIGRLWYKHSIIQHYIDVSCETRKNIKAKSSAEGLGEPVESVLDDFLSVHVEEAGDDFASACGGEDFASACGGQDDFSPEAREDFASACGGQDDFSPEAREDFASACGGDEDEGIKVDKEECVREIFIKYLEILSMEVDEDGLEEAEDINKQIVEGLSQFQYTECCDDLEPANDYDTFCAHRTCACSFLYKLINLCYELTDDEELQTKVGSIIGTIILLLS